MNIRLGIALGASVVMIGLALWLVSARPRFSNENTSPAVAVLTDGVQTVDVTAKGGYSPRVIIAKAGVPTILRVTTKGTFDCSSSLVIPTLGYQQFLRPTDVEEIAISAERAQGTLQGLCAMGMYGFQVRFE